MLERFKQELAKIEQEHQSVFSQKQQLENGVIQANVRLAQLEGAHKCLSDLVKEVESVATQNTSGTTGAMETSEVRNANDVSANV